LREKEALTGVLQINSRELEEEQAAIDSLQKQLSEAVAKTSFRDLDEVREILSVTMELEAEKLKLATFNDQLLRSRSALEQLQKEIGDRIYDTEAHRRLLKTISELRDEESAKKQQQVEIRLLLKQLRESLQSRAKIIEALEKLKARGENIRTMKSLFKASGFVNYISTIYLQQLCNAANDRFFRLTRQKLSLEITPDNNFQVRDFMNEGKVRSVKTLSGGQTFQASLSLALALADNIQQITRSSQNFFFLDEGFGSLDRESLEIVFDTLKTLRRENRIVGVISHVEEMQQEIEAHLRIENDPERGSLIRRSWEE
jgi:exonuclease SbcC